MEESSLTQEATSEETESQEESGVLKALRRQVKDLQRELEARPDRDALLTEIRAEQARVDAISKQVEAMGHPGALSAVLTDRVEGDVTEETVKSALKELGLEASPASAETPSDVDRNAKALAEVSSLSGQLGSAGGGDPPDALSAINKANTMQDLQRIAEQEGFATQY